MKQHIDGNVYDTDKAKQICAYDVSSDGNYKYTDTIMVVAGKFFVWRAWADSNGSIKPLSRQEAYDQACEYMQPFTEEEDVAIEKYFYDLYTELS